MVTIENEQRKVVISEHGAELQSIVNQQTGRSYLWYGDPAYWSRRSPVLFPFVGQVYQKKYRTGGKTYPMSQHGFARDRDFTCAKLSENAASFVQTSDSQTRSVYPFAYCLQISYHLEGHSLFVRWQVTNEGTEEMPFSIGAHPAFLCPPSDENGKLESCSIVFRREDGSTPDALVSRTIDPDSGTVGKKLRQYALQDGRLPVTEHLFDEDALILENRQAADVALADGSGHEFVRVRFPEPLFGVWSPAGKHAPFVCIEPWYGRCDVTGYQGELTDREWEQHCRPGETFDTEYEIITD